MANKFHIRSNSFPTGSHPSISRIEEELTKLKTWEASSTSTSNSIGTGLSLLSDLLICLEDVLNMASTQKLISNNQGEKFIEELLDGSVRILDILFSKKMKKNAKKLMTTLKQMENKFGVSPVLDEDQQLVSLIRVVREVIGMNMSVFQSLLAFLAVPASKSKVTKWVLVAKLMQKGVKACEEKQKNLNELQCVEASLSSLLSEGTNFAKMESANERLEALENGIESIENGLESVFRRMVRTRACLLNIMTQ